MPRRFARASRRGRRPATAAGAGPRTAACCRAGAGPTDRRHLGGQHGLGRDRLAVTETGCPQNAATGEMRATTVPSSSSCSESAVSLRRGRTAGGDFLGVGGRPSGAPARSAGTPARRRLPSLRMRGSRGEQPFDVRREQQPLTEAGQAARQLTRGLRRPRTERGVQRVTRCRHGAFVRRLGDADVRRLPHLSARQGPGVQSIGVCSVTNRVSALRGNITIRRCRPRCPRSTP